MADTVSALQGLLDAFPQLKYLLDRSVGQQEQGDPLRQALLQMAVNIMPNSGFSAFAGRPSISPLSAASRVPPTGGNPTSQATAAGDLVRGGPNAFGGNGAAGANGTGSVFGDSPNGIVYIGGKPYLIPGGTSHPVTGPEDPDPYHHPATDPYTRAVSEGMQKFFMGNPLGAFTGGASGGGGEQDAYPGRAKAY
jgi:hypothetical protein